MVALLNHQQMTTSDFENSIVSHLPYRPNGQQAQVIAALARFCAPTAAEEAAFLLNGYAGTGKTSLCGALVKTLRSAGITPVLMAPTGRAAKVFGAYAGCNAYTIHRKIYHHPGIADTQSSVRSVLPNTYKNAIFIVDEASMITGLDNAADNVLEDLIHYVYTGENCKLILLGDTAQLPPVGSDFSPAMSADTLRSYGLKITKATLTETARQAAHSGILYNATWLRRAMKADPLPLPKLFTSQFADVKVIGAEEMPEELYAAYNRDGMQETIVVTRSNQRAAGFNREIRASILYIEEELAPGELLIVAKNNYCWTQQIKGLDFIANGDALAVEKVLGTETRYGFRFADVLLSIPDTEYTFQAKVMLDTLASESAHLPADRLTALYYGIMEDPDLFDRSTPADARLRALRTNPHWNALQVKYGYAVTCHKAQGGQWKNVFVDMAYIPAEAMGLEFYRWLYTAVSRARSNLYLLGAEQYGN